MIGTTAYFQENYTKKDLAELIQNITSKGGTTEARLVYFKTNILGEQLKNVILSAKNKSDFF